METIDVDAIHETRDFFMKSLAEALHEKFRNVFETNREKGPYAIDPSSIARRKLKNTALSYLSLVEDRCADFVFNEFSKAGNMTDKLAALTLLTDMDHELTTRALDSFYNEWKDDPLVMDKWFAVQAASRRENTLDTVKSLCDHPGFSIKNPNKVRALIGTFAQMNPMAFHNKNGKGYVFLADRVIQLDTINASIAARMVSAFNKWKRYDEDRKVLMKKELTRILETDKLSKGVYEVVSKAVLG
jgi:aminopeptidase N